MAKEKYTCSLHDEDGTVVESTTCWVTGFPGITEWSGKVGPMDEALEIGPAYRLRLEDGRDGLITIVRQLRNWGDQTGNRYEFMGRGTLR